MKKFILSLILIMVVFSMMLNVSATNNKWKQDEFVISTFHAVPGVPNGYTYQMLSKCKEAGLNYIETTFSSAATNHLVLESCDALGLKAIIQDYNMFGGYQDLQVPAKTDEEIEKSVDNAIATYGKYKSLAGYYIWDEPYQDQFGLVRKTLDAFARKVPDKLLFVGSQQSGSPSYKWAGGVFKSYIDDYDNIVNPPIMVSNYSYFYEMDTTGLDIDKTDIWDDLGYERRLALKKNIPFWYYVTLVGDPLTHSMDKATIEKVRFQVNNLLAFGVKGITYYITQTAIYDDFGREMPLFNGVKEINAQTMVLGNAMLNFNSKLVYTTADLKANYIDKLTDSPFVKKATENMMFGEFSSKDNEDYIFIMSRDYEKQYKGSVTLKKKYRIDKMNKKSGKLELVSKSTDTIDINYIASEANLYKISPEGSELSDKNVSTSKFNNGDESSVSGQSQSQNNSSTSATENDNKNSMPYAIGGGALALLSIAGGVFWLIKRKNKIGRK